MIVNTKKKILQLYDTISRENIGDMDCGDCSFCEFNTDLYFLPFEREYIESCIRKVVPYEPMILQDLSYEGMVKTLIRCPFLIKGKCVIHKNRPISCRFYPLDFSIVDDKLEVRIDRNCPKWKDIANNKIFINKTTWAFTNLRKNIENFDFFWNNLPPDSNYTMILCVINNQLNIYDDSNQGVEN